MIKMYFTFGSWEKFPYTNTYMVVEGIDSYDCIETYRCKHPDIHRNCLNCSDYYSEEAWDTRVSKFYMNQEPAEILISDAAKRQKKLAVLFTEMLNLFNKKTDFFRENTVQYMAYLIGTDMEELKQLGVDVKRIIEIVSTERGMRELSWEQVEFLWESGNRYFFRCCVDGTKVSVKKDKWNDLQKHYDGGGTFAIEWDAIYQVDVTIRKDGKELYKYTSKDCSAPIAEELLKICKEQGIYGELDVSAVDLTIDGDYADSEEYGVYVSEDHEKIYLNI